MQVLVKGKNRVAKSRRHVKLLDHLRWVFVSIAMSSRFFMLRGGSSYECMICGNFIFLSRVECPFCLPSFYVKLIILLFVCLVLVYLLVLSFISLCSNGGWS